MEVRKSSFTFPSRKFLGELSYQLSNELEILNMIPDTLYFRFGKLGQKRLKVKPLLNVNLKKQFQISGDIKASPDSVMVRGPQSVLDTLHFVTTELLKFSSVDQTIQTEASIKKIKETFFEPRLVEISVPVEEYTEAQLSVPVNIENQPSGRNIKLFPSKVKVAFQVSLSQFQKIHPEDFKLSVSFSDIKDGKPRLKITSESTPEYLYNLKITPEEIEYLIEN
jgi:YbbR domain-containing protein